MPYRIDIPSAAATHFDRLVDLGALDVEALDDGGLAALLPDRVTPDQVAGALGIGDLSISPATGRDDGSVWVLGLRPIRVGRLLIAPADAEAAPDTIRLTDAPAFGTGLHPTTALCLEAIEELVQRDRPDAVLDVGTGSGILALAALRLGVPRAFATDVDEHALRIAAENAHLNGVEDRLALARGGPETIDGAWPLVLANILAAPLIEMAPALVRRVGHAGQLVLSGIPLSVQAEVDRAYRHLGMRRLDVRTRGGWVALVLQASW